MGDLEYILLLLYVEVPLAISHGSISTFDGQELLPKKSPSRPLHTVCYCYCCCTPNAPKYSYAWFLLTVCCYSNNWCKWLDATATHYPPPKRGLPPALTRLPNWKNVLTEKTISKLKGVCKLLFWKQLRKDMIQAHEQKTNNAFIISPFLFHPSNKRPSK